MKFLKWMWAIELRDLIIVMILSRIATWDLESGRVLYGVLLWFMSSLFFFLAKRT